MSIIDWIILAAYFGMVFGVGLYWARGQRTTEDYFLAGRRVPGWVVAFGILGTMISSTTFIGHPGNVYARDMWNLPSFLMLPIVLLFVSRYVVVFYRRTVRMSVYDYLEQRFNYVARAYGAAGFIVSRIADMSATLYFLAIPVSFLTGMEMGSVILAVGLVTLVMTLAGGIAAVMYSDILQGGLLVAGGLICLGVTLFKPADGPVAVLRTAWEGGKFGLGDWNFSWFHENIWFFLVGGAIWAVQRYALDQHVVQKYLTAKSDREAQTSAYFGALSCLFVWGLFFLFGACLWGFLQLSPGAVPGEVTALKDNVVPYFIKTQLPIGLIGLVVAALIAAAMSSLDSDLNSMATVVVEDYFRRWRPDSTDGQRLWVGRVTVGVLGTFAIVFSQLWIGIGTAMEFAVLLFSVATAGLLGLFALAALSKHATAGGAMVGIAACVLFTAWATLTSVKVPALDRVLLDLGALNYQLHPYLIGIFNHIILFLVGLSSSWILPRAWGSSGRRFGRKAAAFSGPTERRDPTLLGP